MAQFDVAIWRSRVFGSKAFFIIRAVLKAPFVLKDWLCFYFLPFCKKPFLELRGGVRLKMLHFPNFRTSLSEIFMFQPYNGKHFKIQENSIVVDDGAFIGCFTVYAALLACKGQVYAIEPIAEHYAVLNENIQFNHLKNVTAFNFALSGTGGEKNISVAGTSSSLIFRKDAEKNEGMSRVIRTVSLLDFLNSQNISKVDFLKMDCEGAEFEILMNIPPQTLRERVRNIAMEFHNVSKIQNADRLAEHLRLTGYEVFCTPGDWNGLLWAKGQ